LELHNVVVEEGFTTKTQEDKIMINYEILKKNYLQRSSYRILDSHLYEIAKIIFVFCECTRLWDESFP
jgi:hypothetical protein